MLVIGVAFGYFIALPKASHFLANYDKSQYQSFIRARDYIGFSAKVLVAMAIVFELPLFVVGLTRIGIVQTRTLRRSRRSRSMARFFAVVSNHARGSSGNASCHACSALTSVLVSKTARGSVAGLIPRAALRPPP